MLAGTCPPPLVVFGRGSADFYDALQRDIEVGAVSVDIRHPPVGKARPERRLALRGLPTRFRQAVESSLALLLPGLDREIAAALIEHKLGRQTSKMHEAELEGIRLKLRVRPDRFQQAWGRVRCILPLRFCGGLIEWPDVDNGRSWAEHVHEKRRASGHLGAAMQRFGRAIRRWLVAGEDDAPARDEVAAAYGAVAGAQAWCLALGMRVADDLADRTFAAVTKRLAEDPYKRAYARLSAAAAVLGVDEARLRQVWQDLRVRRDLALRHAYGVLHFNAIRLALEGELGAWQWPRAAEDAGQLRRLAAEPPGPEPDTPPPDAPHPAGGGAQA